MTRRNRGTILQLLNFIEKKVTWLKQAFGSNALSCIVIRCLFFVSIKFHRNFYIHTLNESDKKNKKSCQDPFIYALNPRCTIYLPLDVQHI